MLNRSDVSRAVDRPRSRASVRSFLRPMIVAWPAVGLVIGLVAQFSGWGHWASPIWAAATIPVLLALVAEIVISLRRGDVGLDLVAFAERRASREMTALLARVPHTAVRHRNGRLEEVDLDVIEPGDRLVVRKGDVVPVDGAVIEGLAVLDQSALTGEPVPIQQKVGDGVMSGATNVGEAFHLLTTRRAAESTYAGIVRLVEAAQRSRAPMSRLADRYAMVFLAATIALAGASWVWSADPIRAVAVLVVATPCPLILAVPVAIVSGLSRAAKHGILIKGGQALEILARVRSLVIDKTGTLTHGRAHIVATDVVADVSADEILRLAASLDQASKHIMAQTIVDDARSRGLELAIPSNVVETPGEGIEGCVDGRHVIVGGLRFVSGKIGSLSRLHTQRPPGSIAVAVGMDARLVGVLVF